MPSDMGLLDRRTRIGLHDHSYRDEGLRPMPDRQELEARFLANLATIDAILAHIARRHALSRDAADDFGAWVKLKFVEGDYAILAKFRGEASLSTYLAVVISRQYREYRAAEWGRWRPSAAARRNGPLAIRLETLVHRDGMRFNEAAEHLRTSGATTLDDLQLARLLRDLPEHAPLRPVQAGDLPAGAESPERADTLVEMKEASQTSEATQSALSAALDDLPEDDRLLVRLRFIEGLSLADAARAMDVPAKPLYRKLEKTLEALRARLVRAGVTLDQIRGFSTDPPW